MPITWEHESADMLVARISGKLAKSDIAEFQTAVEPIIQASGKISFMVVLDNFEGWEAAKGWEDTGFVDANDQYLSRFAFVGDERWRDQVLMFSLAGLRSVDIQYFSSGQETSARAWLAEE